MYTYIYIYIYVYIYIYNYLYSYSSTVYVDQLKDLIDAWSTHTVEGFKKATKIFVEISAFSFTI